MRPTNGEGCLPAAPGTNSTHHEPIVSDLDADRKQYARFAAPLAIAGFALHELVDGTYLISRWDRTYHAADLAGVRAFCQRAGVTV